MSRIILGPAYGRDYKTQKELLSDFDAGKDFQILDVMHPNCGGYATKAELIAGGVQTANIGYKKFTKVAVVALKGGK